MQVTLKRIQSKLYKAIKNDTFTLFEFGKYNLNYFSMDKETIYVHIKK